MKIYCAGPLFTQAERDFIDGYAAKFRAAGIDCFVPHEQTGEKLSISADSIFHTDYDDGVATSNAVVAWLDGPMCDDGTAVEIGIFYGLMQQRTPWRKGILGLCTDRRRARIRDKVENGGINLFVAGRFSRLERSVGVSRKCSINCSSGRRNSTKRPERTVRLIVYYIFATARLRGG